jgi:hypothetical protein
MKLLGLEKEWLKPRGAHPSLLWERFRPGDYDRADDLNTPEG